MKVAASAATAVVCAAVLTLICGAKPFSHWEDELEGESEDSVVTAAPVGEVEILPKIGLSLLDCLRLHGWKI